MTDLPWPTSKAEALKRVNDNIRWYEVAYELDSAMMVRLRKTGDLDTQWSRRWLGLLHERAEIMRRP